MITDNQISYKMKFKVKGLLIAFNILSIWLIFFIIHVNKNENHTLPLIIISVILILVVLSTYMAYKDNDLLQPIVIVNIFISFIFLARPLHIILGDAILIDRNVFMIYGNLYGAYYVNELPFEQALLVGLLGQISIYVGYYLTFSRSKVNFKTRLDFDYSSIYRTENGIKYGIGIYRLFFFIAILSCALFFLRFNYTLLMETAGKRSSFGISYGTIDILWIYIGTCALLFMFIIREKITPFGWVFIIFYAILMAAIGKRAYIVNILLCILVLTYYIRFQKKINSRLLLLGFTIVISVVLYGSIRASGIGRDRSSSTILDNILGEFSMFDMLLVSIHHEGYFGKFLYGGVNYLTLFDGILPRSIWPWKLTPFDHVHTEVLFQGLYGGALPTSLLGSLYLNFSFIGVIIGGFVFGKLIKKAYRILQNFKTRISIGLYALFTTFIYDIFRVGDIGREFWTFMVYLGVFAIMWWFIKRRNYI